MKKILPIILIAFLSSCLPAEMHKPYFEVKEIKSDNPGMSKYYLNGDGFGATIITIEDSTGKYQVGDSLMFIKKVLPDTAKVNSNSNPFL